MSLKVTQPSVACTARRKASLIPPSPYPDVQHDEPPSVPLSALELPIWKPARPHGDDIKLEPPSHHGCSRCKFTHSSDDEPLYHELCDHIRMACVTAQVLAQMNRELNIHRKGATPCGSYGADGQCVDAMSQSVVTALPGRVWQKRVNAVQQDNYARTSTRAARRRNRRKRNSGRKPVPFALDPDTFPLCPLREIERGTLPQILHPTNLHLARCDRTKCRVEFPLVHRHLVFQVGLLEDSAGRVRRVLTTTYPFSDFLTNDHHVKKAMQAALNLIKEDPKTYRLRDYGALRIRFAVDTLTSNRASGCPKKSLMTHQVLPRLRERVRRYRETQQCLDSETKKWDPDAIDFPRDWVQDVQLEDNCVVACGPPQPFDGRIHEDESVISSTTVSVAAGTPMTMCRRTAKTTPGLVRGIWIENIDRAHRFCQRSFLYTEMQGVEYPWASMLTLLNRMGCPCEHCKKYLTDTLCYRYTGVHDGFPQLLTSVLSPAHTDTFRELWRTHQTTEEEEAHVCATCGA